MEVTFWCCAGLVFYTYCLYPVLMAVLSYLRPGVEKPGVAVGRVSVVVVVHNEEARILSRLENLLSQEPPGLVGEIIVVSDGSDDGTCEAVTELARRDTRVRLIAVPERRGKAAGLNTGIAAVKHGIVVFTDARQEFQPDATRLLVSRFADSTVGAVSGELRFKEHSIKGHVSESLGLYWRYETWLRRSEANFDSLIGCAGAIYAARRDRIKSLPDGLILDDVWIPIHVVMSGNRVVYEHRAIAWDIAREALGDEFRRKVRTLAGNLQLVSVDPLILSPIHNRLWWVFISHKLCRLVVPYALVTALAINVGLTGPYYTATLILQFVFYSLGIMGYLGPMGRNKKICKLCNAVKVFLGINAAAAVGLVVALAGRYNSLWTKPTSHGQP
jgi:poly-beta-1,6-N-acetyl-D-glucosamine synthase